MNKMKLQWMCVLVLACCGMAFGQGKSVSEVLDSSVKNVEGEFVPGHYYYKRLDEPPPGRAA